MTTDTTKTRRSFVRACGKTAVTATVVGSVAVAGSAIADHFHSIPEHVTLSFDDDKALLEKYQPSLVTVDLDEKPESTHAFVARSTEFDTTALVYFNWYDEQPGFTVYDSHDGDREPFYCFIADEGTADERLSSVSYSAYHWFRGWSSDPPVSDRSGTNPKAYVFDPHHHHSTEVSAATDYVGEYPGLRDLRETYPSWLNNGLESDIATGVVYEPWRMEGSAGRSDWWNHSGLSSVERTVRSVFLRAGIGDADRSDLK